MTRQRIVLALVVALGLGHATAQATTSKWAWIGPCGSILWTSCSCWTYIGGFPSTCYPAQETDDIIINAPPRDIEMTDTIIVNAGELVILTSVDFTGSGTYTFEAIQFYSDVDIEVTIDEARHLTRQ